MALIERYIAGWRLQDTTAILATLTPDCVVIESFGPVYRGHGWVRRWVEAWISENGRVIDWEIRDMETFGDVEIAEWIFRYTIRGKENVIEGSTIARLRGNLIYYLREYASTGVLYDWKGEWKSL